MPGGTSSSERASFGDPRPTTHDPRPTTHDRRPTTHDPRPLNAPDPKPSRWLGDPRWFIWDDGFMALGRSEGIVPPHDHHAIQVVIAVDGTVGIRSDPGDWQMAAGVIVTPDFTHSYDGNGATGALLFVDPNQPKGSGSGGW